MFKIIQWIKNKFRNRKMKKFFKYYRSRPDKFCEEFLGIKLLEYQKELLRGMMKNEPSNH